MLWTRLCAVFTAAVSMTVLLLSTAGTSSWHVDPIAPLGHHEDRGNVNSSSSPSPMPPRRPEAWIALIAHGWSAKGYETTETIKGRKRSMELALKGLLRTVSSLCSLHLVFVTGAADESRIRAFLADVVSPAHTSVRYSFVPLNETLLAVWMGLIGHTPSHRTGAAGNIKFFYPLLFPKVDRIMMLDTDILIGRDICALWGLFDQFSPQQLFSFAPQWPKVHPVKDNIFNAGVALLHLERMRQAEWLTLARDAIVAWDTSGRTPRCCAHGDQSAFHMIRAYRPETLTYLLPRWWNINKCHGYHLISDRNGDAMPPSAFVGIVHLGCCKMCTRGDLWPRWQRLLDAIDAHPIHGQHQGTTPLVEVPVSYCRTHVAIDRRVLEYDAFLFGHQQRCT